MLLRKPSHSWWFDSRNSPRRSPWLQSTLSELDERTKAMLKLIDDDGDSFVQRTEMYYKKRPELINMLKDFYQGHCSLAKQLDQLKSSSGTRLTTPAGSLLYSKYQLQKLTSSMVKSYDSYSETFDSDDCCESEVDDPEQEETQVGIEREEVSSAISDNEVMKLKEEIERLKEENRIQKDQLMEKDEDKREVIRELSLALEIFKEENMSLKKCLTKKESPSKKWSPFDFNKLKDTFSDKLFSGSSKSQISPVAL